MIDLIKKLMPYVCILGIIGVMAIALGMSGSSLVVYNSEFNLYEFSLYNYLLNVQYGFNSFSQNISKFTAVDLDWSSFINGLKSICNIVIAVLNAVLLPLSILGSVLNILLSLVGLPLNNSNFLYFIFNGIGSLQIPYIDI